MRRFLPIFLVLIGILALVGVYFFVVKGKGEKPPTTSEESALIEVPPGERPIASLTPTSDGHFLNLKIEKVLAGAVSLDYELLYSVADGRTQGVPGTVPLTGQSEIERKLLMGSESSGKFRYDEGVEKGSLTIRFRNSDGKLMAKFSTDFTLESDTDSLATVDGKFSAKLGKKEKAFFVVMETFGIPENPPGDIISGPYGIFSSSKPSGGGEVKSSAGKIYRAASRGWTSEVSGAAFDIGIFVATSD